MSKQRTAKQPSNGREYTFCLGECARGKFRGKNSHFYDAEKNALAATPPVFVNKFLRVSSWEYILCWSTLNLSLHPA
jgi:hypothetical protein